MKKKTAAPKKREVKLIEWPKAMQKRLVNFVKLRRSEGVNMTDSRVIQEAVDKHLKERDC